MLTNKLGSLSLAVFAMLMVLTLGYGFEHRVPRTAWVPYFAAWSLALIPVFLWLGYALINFPGSNSRDSLPRWLPALATMGMFCLTAYFWLPTVQGLAVSLGTVATCSFFLNRRQFLAALAIPLTANLLLAIWLSGDPATMLGADMLPIMTAANHYFMMGLNPYGQQYENLFFYLPLQWLVYLPSVALGIDLRYENAAILAVLTFQVLRWAKRASLNTAGVTLICCVLVSRIAIEMVLRGLVWPYWALLIVFCAAMLRSRWRSAALLLGLMVATQQPALLIAGLSGIYVFVNRGLRDAMIFGCLASAAYAVVLAPWVIARPAMLYYVYIQVQQQIAALHAAFPIMDAKEISLLNLLQVADVIGLRSMLQLACLAIGIGFILVNRRMGPARLLCAVGVVFLAAISFNVQVFKYYYYPGLIFLALGIGAVEVEQRRSRPDILV